MSITMTTPAGWDARATLRLAVSTDILRALSWRSDSPVADRRAATSAAGKDKPLAASPPALTTSFGRGVHAGGTGDDGPLLLRHEASAWTGWSTSPDAGRSTPSGGDGVSIHRWML